MTDADTIRQYVGDVMKRADEAAYPYLASPEHDAVKLAGLLKQAVEALEEIATGRYAAKTFTREQHANNALAAIAKQVRNVQEIQASIDAQNREIARLRKQVEAADWMAEAISAARVENTDWPTYNALLSAMNAYHATASTEMD